MYNDYFLQTLLTDFGHCVFAASKITAKEQNQKQEDHKDPPEELTVADGCDRRCGFRHKYNADDRQDHAAETEFFLHRLASLSLRGVI